MHSNRKEILHDVPSLRALVKKFRLVMFSLEGEKLHCL